MRLAGITVLLALALAACSNPPGTRDGNDAQRQAQAKRDLERECRISNEMGQRDPRCPQSEDMGTAPSSPTLPRVPPPPTLPPVN